MRPLATALLSSFCAALAFADGDVVDLTNGDRISGTIVQMDGDHLLITTPYGTKLILERAHVKSIESETAHVVRL